MISIYDLVDGKEIVGESHLDVARVLNVGSYDIKRLTHGSRGKLSYKHIGNRYVSNQDSEDIFTLVHKDGKEYRCITNKTLFLHLGIPYKKEEAAYISVMKTGKQQWVKINDQLFYLKTNTPEREYARTFRTDEERRLMNKATSRAKYLRNKEKIKAVRKIYLAKNRKKVTAKLVAYSKKRRLIDPSFRIANALRGRLYYAIKNQSGARKFSKTEILLGCTFSDCKKHIESLWKEGMTWENYGLYGWHIDHIIPCSSFDLTKPEEQSKCFHYTNLQPLWARENLSKGNKVFNLPENSPPQCPPDERGS